MVKQEAPFNMRSEAQARERSEAEKRSGPEGFKGFKSPILKLFAVFLFIPQGVDRVAQGRF